jgi:hypothetical protein
MTFVRRAGALGVRVPLRDLIDPGQPRLPALDDLLGAQCPPGYGARRSPHGPWPRSAPTSTGALVDRTGAAADISLMWTPGAVAHS